MSYAAPLADMRFVLEEVAELDELAQLPGYEAASPDLVEAILGEAAKLAGNELAPLNQPADRTGSVLENGVVRTPPGFREAYARYVEGGWNGLGRVRLRSLVAGAHDVDGTLLCFLVDAADILAQHAHPDELDPAEKQNGH